MAKAKSKANLGKLTLDVVAKTGNFEKALDRIKAKLDMIVERLETIKKLRQ